MREYSKPTVEHLGSIADLTAGGSVNAAEDNNNGNNGGTMDTSRLS